MPAAGTVASVTSTSVTISEANGTKVTYTTSSSTKVSLIESSSVADLTIGQAVMITTKTSGGHLVAVSVTEGALIAPAGEPGGPGGGPGGPAAPAKPSA